MHPPRQSYGGCTKEDRWVKWALALPIRAGSTKVASASIEPSYEHEVMTVVDHALTFTGMAHGAPMRTSCVWTVEENIKALPPVSRLNSKLQWYWSTSDCL